jgi:hypothetical protein
MPRALRVDRWRQEPPDYLKCIYSYRSAELGFHDPDSGLWMTAEWVLTEDDPDGQQGTLTRVEVEDLEEYVYLREGGPDPYPEGEEGWQQYLRTCRLHAEANYWAEQLVTAKVNYPSVYDVVQMFLDCGVDYDDLVNGLIG